MKKSKRFLSLLLAVAMVMGLMLSGVSATTVASDSNVIMSESFESWASAATEITSDYSVAGGATSWNGATAAEGWAISAQNGSVLVQPALNGAQDGNVSMKLTLGTDTTTMNRAKLQYRMPQSVYDKMEHGAEYTFTVYFKGTAKGNYEVKTFVPGVTNWPNKDVVISNEWAKTEYKFTLDKETPNPAAGVTTMDIFIGIPWHAAGALSGELYIDNVSIVKTKDAPKPEGGEGGNEEADPNEILAEDFEELTELGVSGVAGAVFNENYWGADAYEFSSDAKSGSKSIKLMAEKMTNKPSWTQNEYGIGRLTLLLDISKFEVGATYKVAGWFKASEGCPQLDIDAQAYGQTGQLNVGNPVTNAGTDWYKYEVEFVMPEGITATQMVFRFGVSYPVADTTPYALVDDISIVKTKDAPKPEGGEGGNEGDEGGETDSADILNESFESWIGADTVITDIYSKGNEVTLNGAVAGSEWSVYAPNGEVVVKPVKDKAKDGSISVVLHPKDTTQQNRASLTYTMTAEDYAKMEDGATYKVTVYMYSDGAKYQGRWEIKDKDSDWFNENFDLTNGEWIEKVYIFTLDKSVRTKPLELAIGMAWHGATASTGDLYIDSVSITKVEKEEPGDTTPEFGVIWEESFETFADANTVITDTPSVAGKGDWNGATVAPGWGTYVSSGGSVVLQPAVGTAQDGNVSIKLTPTTGGRMQIIYSMPAADYQKLVDGGRYRVTVHYKSEGADFGAQLEAKAMSAYVVTPVTIKNGEWAGIPASWIL